MLYTCCTSTNTVLVLLIAAAPLKLGVVASPIVRRETNCTDLTSAEANLRDGLFVAGHIVGIYNLVSFKVCATISAYEYSYIVCSMLHILTRLGKLN